MSFINTARDISGGLLKVSGLLSGLFTLSVLASGSMTLKPFILLSAFSAVAYGSGKIIESPEANSTPAPTPAQ